MPKPKATINHYKFMANACAKEALRYKKKGCTEASLKCWSSAKGWIKLIYSGESV